MTENIGYPLRIINRNTTGFALWIEGDSAQDYLLKDSKGRILISKTRADLIKQSAKILRGKWSFEKTVSYDFNKFRSALKSLKAGRYSRTTTCQTLNSGWNLIEDMLSTVGALESSDLYQNRRLKKMYGKIFYGCNLPAITPKNKSYHPIWLASETAALKHALLNAFLSLENTTSRKLF